jgi:hypothetical protein
MPVIFAVILIVLGIIIGTQVPLPGQILLLVSI